MTTRGAVRDAIRGRRGRRGRAAVATAVAAGLLLAAGAAHAVVATVTSPFDATAVESCPGTASIPCAVVSRTTALQEVVGTTRLPMRLPRSGRIVGWQISLSSPSLAQIKFFDANEGGPSEAAVAVIRHVEGLEYRLVALTPVTHLQPYFGRTASFPLVTSIPVRAGDVIALTVPTWVPALELRAGTRTAWRASRSGKRCANVTDDTAQTAIGSVSEYACIYQAALVDFGAIEISTP
jgi:hypothetical protein